VSASRPLGRYLDIRLRCGFRCERTVDRTQAPTRQLVRERCLRPNVLAFLPQPPHRLRALPRMRALAEADQAQADRAGPCRGPGLRDTLVQQRRRRPDRRAGHADDGQADQHSVLPCPDCGGMMRELKAGTMSCYQRHIGHPHTATPTQRRQSQPALTSVLERAITSAHRALNEGVGQ
jgi:hypothetical protein